MKQIPALSYRLFPPGQNVNVNVNLGCHTLFCGWVLGFFQLVRPVTERLVYVPASFSACGLSATWRLIGKKSRELRERMQSDFE